LILNPKIECGVGTTIEMMFLMAAQATIEDRLLILTLKAPESGTSEKTSSPPCGVLAEEE
jgi:hypothetical protein